jgi:hypothetical protein
MGVDRAFGDFAAADAVKRVVPHNGQEQAPEVVVRSSGIEIGDDASADCREWPR